MSSSKELDVGYTYEYTVQITDDTVRKFAEVSGDRNPIHLDDAYAKTTRFGRRIAHGMILGGFISKSLVEGLGVGGIYLSQTMKFSQPAYIDDTVTVRLEVKSIRKERGLASVETTVTNQNGETLLKGDAMIMVASSPMMK